MQLLLPTSPDNKCHFPFYPEFYWDRAHSLCLRVSAYAVFFTCDPLSPAPLHLLTRCYFLLEDFLLLHVPRSKWGAPLLLQSLSVRSSPSLDHAISETVASFYFTCQPGLMRSSCLDTGFQSMVPEAAAAWTQLRVPPRLTESETQEVGPSILWLNRTSRWFWWRSRLRLTGLEVSEE